MTRPSTQDLRSAALTTVSALATNPKETARGLVDAGLRGARRLPLEAVKWPVIGLSIALEKSEALRREGKQLVGLIRGEEPLPKVHVPAAPRREAEPEIEPLIEPATELPAEPVAELAVEAGAPGTAEAVVEEALQQTKQPGPAEQPGAPLAHDELPLADYDHLTLGSLRARLRSLDIPQLGQLRDYEKAHANRLQVVTMFDNRIAKLAETPPTA